MPTNFLKTVLVADDQEPVRTSMSFVLEELGYSLPVANPYDVESLIS